MRVRASQHPAHEHARKRVVGAESGAAGYLVDPIGTDRALADPFEFLEVVRHGYPFLMSAATSRTERMILS